MTKRSPRNGTIITFYSYKGGTGRSMAMANVAWILASQGHDVLAIDWDLEAPGLHRYFHPFLRDPRLESTDGLIDIVTDYTTAAVSNTQSESREWSDRYADVLRYVLSLDVEFPKGGTIDLLCAGRQSVTYSTRVNTFDWRHFYDKLDGGAFLERLKQRMRDTYDFILIDSRTGVSDTSGICTVQFPDSLVVCFTLNNQSIEGASGIALSVLAQRPDIRILPVPTRVEIAEKEKLEKRRHLARSRFALFPNTITDADAREEYWSAVEMLYWPYYAYEEVLATLADRPGQPGDHASTAMPGGTTPARSGNSLLAAVERLTAFLTDGQPDDRRVRQLGPMPEQRRLDLLARYTSDEPVTEDELARTAEAIWERVTPADRDDVRKLFQRLVRVARPGEGSDGVVSTPVTAVQTLLARAQPFLNAGVLRTDQDGTSKVQVITIADPGLITRWGRLTQWIEQDRDFLTWLQQLQSNRISWVESDRAAGTTLAGERLKIAKRWLDDRPASLTKDETDYIVASRRTQLRQQVFTGIVMSAVLIAIGAGSVRSYLHGREDDRRDQALMVLESANNLVLGGDPVAALDSFNYALELNPLLSAAYSGRGRLLFARGDTSRALADFDSATYLDSSNVNAWLGRAGLRSVRGDWSGAILDYSRSLSIDTTDVGAYFERGVAYQRSGQSARAIADFQTVVERATDARTIEAARTRLDSLGVRTTVPSAPIQVFVHHTAGADAKAVSLVVGALRENGFTVVSTVPADGITSNDVRSFFDTDRGAADSIAAILEKEAARFGYRVRFERIARDSVRFPSARRGRIEVWIGPSLYGPSSLPRSYRGSESRLPH